jgi:hypothetical protein
MDGKMDSDTQMVWGSVTLALVAGMWSKFGDIGTIPLIGMYGFSAYTVLSYMMRGKMRRFFKAAGLATLEQAPADHVKITSYGELHKIKMLPGQSSEDYEKKKLNLEQYLNCGTEMEYKNGRLFIKCFMGSLGNLYPYEYIKHKKPLEITLGKTRDGYFKVDIATMPHMLLGGETGGGKSCLLRNIVTSLIISGRCKLHLADMAMVEMGLFADSKMVEDYCTSEDEVMAMLNKLTKISQHRLETLKASHKTKISDNTVRHVVIIDEFSGITNKAVKSLLMRRISMDRKVGIHYILSTQYPKAEIVNTTISNNMPCRIATRVATGKASEVILGRSGAQNLTVVGRMLCKYNGEIKEFQGFWLDEDEAMELTKHTFVIAKDPPKEEKKKPDPAGKEKYHADRKR